MIDNLGVPDRYAYFNRMTDIKAFLSNYGMHRQTRRSTNQQYTNIQLNFLASTFISYNYGHDRNCFTPVICRWAPLIDLKNGAFRWVWHMQDGAPAHRALPVRNSLQELGNRVVGMGHQIDWSARRSLSIGLLLSMGYSQANSLQTRPSCQFSTAAESHHWYLQRDVLFDIRRQELRGVLIFKEAI